LEVKGNKRKINKPQKDTRKEGLKISEGKVVSVLN
jgi:hypothetical protein